MIIVVADVTAVVAVVAVVAAIVLADVVAIDALIVVVVLPSTGVTLDTRGNFGQHIKFSLFCLFFVVFSKY